MASKGYIDSTPFHAGSDAHPSSSSSRRSSSSRSCATGGRSGGSAHAALSEYHDCTGCIFFVDEFGTLQSHRSNQNYHQDRKLFKQFAQAKVIDSKDGGPRMVDEQKLKAPVPVAKLCPACESIKLIYPNSSSQSLRKAFLLKTSNVQNKISNHVLRTHENNMLKANSINLQAYYGHANRKGDGARTEDASYDAMLSRLNQNAGGANSFRLSEYYK